MAPSSSTIFVVEFLGEKNKRKLCCGGAIEYLQEQNEKDKVTNTF